MKRKNIQAILLSAAICALILVPTGETLSYDLKQWLDLYEYLVHTKYDSFKSNSKGVEVKTKLIWKLSEKLASQQKRSFFQTRQRY